MLVELVRVAAQYRVILGYYPTSFGTLRNQFEATYATAFGEVGHGFSLSV